MNPVGKRTENRDFFFTEQEASFVQSKWDSQVSLRSSHQSLLPNSLDISISDTTQRKADALAWLKKLNEEKAKKGEFAKSMKEMEEEDRRETLLNSLNNT